MRENFDDFESSNGTNRKEETMCHGKRTTFVTRGNENVKITKEEKERLSAGAPSWPERNDFEELSSCRTHETQEDQ